jgi:hypothetical protein
MMTLGLLSQKLAGKTANDFPAKLMMTTCAGQAQKKTFLQP